MSNREQYPKTNLEKMLQEYSTNEVLLRTSVIEKYDCELTKIFIKKIVTAYVEAKYNMLLPLKDVKSSNPSNALVGDKINYADRIGDSVEFKCDNEIEAKRLEADLNYVYENMTVEEKLYWNIVIMKEKSSSVVEEALGLSKIGIKPIKDSCIIKVGMLLGIAVFKGEKKPRKSFSKRINEIINCD